MEHYLFEPTAIVLKLENLKLYDAIIEPMNDTLGNISKAVNASQLPGYLGVFKELGGGELNDTFLLDCGKKKVILRISKHANTNTLYREAETLKLLRTAHVPELIFFDKSQRINGKSWIIESYLEGKSAKDLTTKQYASLGKLLAHLHTVTEPNPKEVDFWQDLLDDCRLFGDETTLMKHPNVEIKELVHQARDYFYDQKSKFAPIHRSLIHGDATPNNILVNDDEVSLIDWELSRFRDPMAEFSTMYYPDMEYNKGLWRTHITEDKQAALFTGYCQAGGAIDRQRLDVWMNLDKLGAAIYLYWKMYESGHRVNNSQLTQYRHDFGNLIKSLQLNLREHKKS